MIERLLIGQISYYPHHSGLVWAWRIGRVNRGHHVVLSLVSGITIFLFLLALTPHPTPPLTHPGVPHGAARRIQQEADDYTGPKVTKVAILPDDTKDPSGDHQFVSPESEVEPLLLVDQQIPHDVSSVREAPYMKPIISQPYSSARQSGDTGRGQVELVTQDTSTSHGGVILTDQYSHTLNRYNAPPSSLQGISLTAQGGVGGGGGVGGVGARFSQGRYNPQDINEALSQVAFDIPKNQKEKQQMLSAQERALEAQQHGYRLTQNQKTLLSRLSPANKAAIQRKNLKMRERQDKAYLEHLRAKKQIIPRKDGGEEIYSSPRATIRFPVSLQHTTKIDWFKPEYAIFANLTHHPWVKTEECQNYTITFYPPASHKTWALASFPSSGNTWIRYLIEGATGVFTGSLYDDNSLIRKGMYGEGIPYDSGMTVLQKTHGFTTKDGVTLPHSQQIEKNHMKELNNRGVIVIRNPFKAIISHRHLDVGGHTGYAPRAHFIGTGWVEFVTLKIRLWRDFYIDWTSLTDPHNIHITHYENVRDNLVGEMWKILNYLNIQPDPGRLQCLANNADGLFKRKPSKSVPLDFNPFTQELKDLVYKAIDDVNSALEVAGKEMLPLDKYEIYDAKEAKISRTLRQQATDGHVPH
ncbi:hypothetical protein Pcinc_042009 [Petrolisthes cinctipes]|uniref:Sulfotransferase domain-containing protein n=1 Tax=Petrolisthes cinctipes TaxID=88211 RepID=A0AAE1BM45_PETCI|nr:hypothetical protein Pcinc_042009 [Petrolisthes cinctipes]